MEIKQASTKDSNALTELTLRSKSHWGYTPEQMEEWRSELTIDEPYILNHPVFLIENNHQIQGYYSYFKISGTTVKLDNLFVDPAFIGLGLGGLLMADFLKRATASGFEKITLEADPNAENFYKKYGFQTVGQLQSSVPGRYLPVMELPLQPESTELR